MKFAKRTDKSQAVIVKDLRKAGIQTVITNMGNDFPDVICGYVGRWTLLEVKEVTGQLSRGQLVFLTDARGRIGVVSTSSQALRLIVADEGLITSKQQVKLAQWLLLNPLQESMRIKKFFEVINA